MFSSLIIGVRHNPSLQMIRSMIPERKLVNTGGIMELTDVQFAFF